MMWCNKKQCGGTCCRFRVSDLRHLSAAVEAIPHLVHGYHGRETEIDIFRPELQTLIQLGIVLGRRHKGNQRVFTLPP